MREAGPESRHHSQVQVNGPLTVDDFPSSPTTFVHSFQCTVERLLQILSALFGVYKRNVKPGGEVQTTATFMEIYL